MTGILAVDCNVAIAHLQANANPVLQPKHCQHTDDEVQDLFQSTATYICQTYKTLKEEMAAGTNAQELKCLECMSLLWLYHTLSSSLPQTASLTHQSVMGAQCSGESPAVAQSSTLHCQFKI